MEIAGRLRDLVDGVVPLLAAADVIEQSVACARHTVDGQLGEHADDQALIAICRWCGAVLGAKAVRVEVEVRDEVCVVPVSRFHLLIPTGIVHHTVPDQVSSLARGECDGFQEPVAGPPLQLAEHGVRVG